MQLNGLTNNKFLRSDGGKTAQDAVQSASAPQKRKQSSSYNHMADIRKSAYILAFGHAWAIDILSLFSRIPDKLIPLESDLK